MQSAGDVCFECTRKKSTSGAAHDCEKTMIDGREPAASLVSREGYVLAANRGHDHAKP